MPNVNKLKIILQDLTGQKAPFFDTPIPENAISLLTSGAGLGFSQLNELLLMLGYDRITHSFFQFLVNGTIEYRPDSSINSFEQLRKGVDHFRKIAILFYGNVKFAFKNLSGDPVEFEGFLASLKPMNSREYKKRHDPVLPIETIPPENTYYLGYIIEEELRKKIENGDSTAIDEEKRRTLIVEKGKTNHEAYLACDHLDVYVATSMRLPHEYLFANRTINQIFKNSILKDLKLRWFDPTQAYCQSRIDKSLAEALMLKRAKCTIYLAQESETLGKDSELACTLAQGKPVIVYIPKVNEMYVDEYLSDLKKINKNDTEKEIILEQLRVFDSSLAWEKDSKIQEWINNPDTTDLKSIKKLLEKTMRQQYDKKAEVLCETHPLGIQVNITTGVANGVLVVRTIKQCAKLIKNIVLKKLEFNLDVEKKGSLEYLYLREKISNCVFRVVTGDAKLTNTFWNYYLKQE